MSPRVVHISNSDIALRIHARNYFAYLRDQGYDLQVVCSPGELVKGDMVTDEGRRQSDLASIPLHTRRRSQGARYSSHAIFVSRDTTLYIHTRQDLACWVASLPGWLARRS